MPRSLRLSASDSPQMPPPIMAIFIRFGAAQMAKFLAFEWTKSLLLCQHGLVRHRLPHEGGDSMDKALYDRGMAMRRKVLGDEYVDRAVANTDDFNRQFQELLTTYCWGAVWGDDALKP